MIVDQFHWFLIKLNWMWLYSETGAATPSVLRSRSAKIPSIQAKKSQLKIQTSSLPTKGEAPRTPEIEGSISEREQGSRAIHQSQSRSGVAKVVFFFLSIINN